MRVKDPTGRLARWSLQLQQYDFEIIHRAGTVNANADALSRRTYSLDALTSNVIHPHSLPLTVVDQSCPSIEQLYQFQRQDNNLYDIICYLESKELPSNDLKARSILLTIDSYFINEHGILCHLWTPGGRRVKSLVPQVVIPASLRHDILVSCHDDATAGHLAPRIAQLIVDQILAPHGAPRTLLSDRGANFLASIVKEVCALINTRHLHTTSYHPQTDGLVERFNATLAEGISMYVSSHQKDWDKHIPLILFAYRVSPNATTGESPFYLLYGREPRLPIDTALLMPDTNLSSSVAEHRERVVRNLEEAQRIISSNTELAQQLHANRLKPFYDPADRPIEPPTEAVPLPDLIDSNLPPDSFTVDPPASPPAAGSPDLTVPDSNDEPAISHPEDFHRPLQIRPV
eukprot:gene14549-16052_t